MGQCEGCLNQYIQKYNNECCCLYKDVKKDILINKCYVEKICDCRNQPFGLTKEQAFLAIEKLIKQYDERQQKPQSVMYSLRSIINQVKNKKELCRLTKCLDNIDGSNPCKYTCEKCGKVNAIESNYCSECGQKL